MGLFKSDKKIISIVNQKGGVGKTTITYNLAYALARRKKRVLALDFDPQGNLSTLFETETDINREYHIHHLLINSVRELKQLHVPVLVNDLLREREGVSYLPAGHELSGFELTVAAVNTPRQLILKKFLEKSALLDHFDYVLIDAPPTLGLLLVNILCACDGLIVPYRPDDFSRSGLLNLKNILNEIAEMEIVTPPEVIAAVPNLVELRRRHDQDELIKFDEEVGSIFEGVKNLTPISNRVLLTKSNALKKSIFANEAAEYEELKKDFLKMADTLISWSAK